MGEREEEPPPPSTTSFSTSSSSSSLPLKLTASSSSSLRPTITLPPRTSIETLFNGGGGGGGGNSSGSGLGLSGLGFSPGPMTLVSSFFNDNDDCKSFSQLLAGAMTSPAAQRPSLPPPMAAEDAGGGGGGGKDDDKSFSGGCGEEEFRFQQNRPTGLAISPSSIFTVPPGLSPAGFLDSPGQGPFGMTHQQALAQVTAQAAQAHTHVHIQADYSSSLSAAPATSLTQLPAFTTNTTTHQQVPPSIPDSGVVNQSSDFSHFDQRSQPSSFAVDKPADDGYNWRKYGQKQVKGSEFPRSYYKCTFSGCPVKKMVERSLDGQLTEIIYKGQHNHQPPQKRAKDTGNSNQGNPDFASQVQSGNLNKLKEGTGLYLMSKKDQESGQATPEHLSGTSDSEEVGDAETGVDEKDEHEPEAKRQSTEVRVSESASSHRTVTEPRIIVQTTSEVDRLDDGYRWRKYGQKVVKGNPYPRGYYKCATVGCNVRKHVERASSDPKTVITTYEGKHNHDIPAARTSSHNTANSIASQSKPDKVLPEKHSLINNMGLGNKWKTYSINLGILDKNGEKQIASEPHGMMFSIEPVKMTISSEQKKIEIGEIGNLASQERQPECIQVEEMQPQALSTQGVVFDDGAVKILKSNGQMESQIEDIEMEPEASAQCGLFLMQGGLGLTKLPKDDDWKNAKEIYLMDNELSILPENPRCPNLSALFLPRNYKLRTIPPSFFDYMPALQILNLSRTGIKSLPDSLIRLVSLKRLFLNDCHRLMTLSPKVGNLKLLEVLDLEGAKIMDLTMEIKELTNLKCLEVSFYGYMSNGRRAMQSNAMVPCGVISALSQLEELNIDVNPDDERWDACVEDIVTEVCTLTRLETFKFYFPRVELLRHFHCNRPLLSHFRFTVGSHVKRIMSRVPCDVEFELERWERCLRYINGVGIPKDIKNVLHHVTAFFLDRHVTVKKLSDFGTRNMKQLKCCVVGECNEVQVIIDAQDAYGEDGISEIVSESYDAEKIVLGSLEYLYIYYMKSLRSIWEGSVQKNSLFLLKSLTLRTCPQLTTIFTQGLLANLFNLEEIKVEDCPSIKSIVSCEISAEHRSSYFLPNLKKITLHYMPGLISISSGLQFAPKLEWLSFYNCPNLKNPLIDEISSQDLRKIKGERSWWEALEWSSSCPSYLEEIFVPIDIQDC